MCFQDTKDKSQFFIFKCHTSGVLVMPFQIECQHEVNVKGARGLSPILMAASPFGVTQTGGIYFIGAS